MVDVPLVFDHRRIGEESVEDDYEIKAVLT